MNSAGDRGSVGHEAERVAVRRRGEHSLGRANAAGARHVFDHEALAETLAELIGNDARANIRDATGAEGQHDLDAVSRLDLGVALEAVEDAEAFGGMIDGGHAMRQRVHGVARLHGDHLDAQRPCRLDFLEREAAERIDGLAGVAFALGGLLLGGENEAVDVAAKT